MGFENQKNKRESYPSHVGIGVITNWVRQGGGGVWHDILD